MKIRRRLVAVSLFSGMGGMDLGIKRAGFDIRAHVDNDPDCIKTLERNWKKSTIIEADISKLSSRKLLKLAKLRKCDVDLVFGGPSCQPFSRSNEGKRKGIHDSRGKMIFEFCRLVKEMAPKAFIMENVVGLLSSNQRKDFKNLLKRYAKIGYSIHYKILNAANYGVPQKRKRLFLVGFREKKEFVFPKETHGVSDGQLAFVTAGEVLKSLDDGIVHDGAKTIGGKYGKLINRIPPGMNYIYYTAEYGCKKPKFKDRSKFWTFLLKLNPKQPATTIQAQPWNSVGPFHWNNRRLTLKEIKRLQGIPVRYSVYESCKRGTDYGTSGWMQVGNAVPPKLSKIVAREVREQLR